MTAAPSWRLLSLHFRGRVLQMYIRASEQDSGIRTLKSSEVEQQFSDASGYLITCDVCQM